MFTNLKNLPQKPTPWAKHRKNKNLSDFKLVIYSNLKCKISFFFLFVFFLNWKGLLDFILWFGQEYKGESVTYIVLLFFSIFLSSWSASYLGNLRSSSSPGSWLSFSSSSYTPRNSLSYFKTHIVPFFVSFVINSWRLWMQHKFGNIGCFFKKGFCTLLELSLWSISTIQLHNLALQFLKSITTIH